jgi:hypothetical protein
VAQHAFNRVMGFAGIGRPKDRRDRAGRAHVIALWPELPVIDRCPKAGSGSAPPPRLTPVRADV